MACNRIQSISSSQMKMKYDVYVSFSGVDTRHGFTCHLFAALRRKGILTFRDDENIKKGEAIAPKLLQAIEGSRVFIVVFSKNYASSTWRLRELAKIVDCLKVSPTKRVLPVFYDVDPSEVRYQRGNFGEAFAKHEERFKQELDKVQTWKAALTQVGNLSGWDLRDKPQYAEIEKIVEETMSRLDYKFSSLPNDLVGWQTPIEELEKLLLLGSDDDVQVVGICGSGGIGKTTLATVLYAKISHRYNARCFIDDVSKLYRDDGSIGAQKQLLFQTLKEDNLHICNHSEAANLIQSRLRHVKALIVVDNVDKVEQLEKLAVNRAWLGGGSRIIIISTDDHILRDYGVDVVYNMQLLSDDNALRLFCRKAFKSDDFKNGYRKLTFDALTYARSLPLAIKVLGSNFYGQSVFEWRTALGKLREHRDVLQISYDGLEDIEKEIFLDVACFFDAKEEIYISKILNFRGFHPDIGIKVLVDKSLITRSNGRIYMHDLLKDFGRSIVQKKSLEKPRKWSRLWDFEDLHNAMLKNKASENLEAIVLQMYSEEKKTVRADALSQMSHLNLLILGNVNFSGSLDYLSNELRYLSWDKYPFTCLPSSFEADKLVDLILPHSNIKQLWEGTKPLYKLICMDLSHSKNLIKIPNFREVPNLEGCINLVRIDPSIGLLKKLVLLNLKNCKNLASIPKNIVSLSSLEILNLSDCSKLNLVLVEHLEMLDASETGVHWQSASSICEMLLLPINFFCPNRHEEPVGLPNFPCLCDLDLSFCNLLRIPDSIGSLHHLERLNLGGNSFATLPCSIKKLSKLIFLNLEHCKQLRYLPELPSITVLPIRRERFLGSYAGLYIFNCLNLCEPERYCRLAFSWVIQVIELHIQSSLLFHEFGVVIPGSQIPRWFNNQNVGSSISIDPAPIMHDNNWIGVACCAAFVAHPNQTDLGNEWEPYIGIGFGKEYVFGRFPVVPLHLGKDLVTIELDHQLLHFFTRQEFIDHFASDITEEPHDFDGIKMETVISTHQGLHLEVRNCGYRLVFKEDLQKLNTTMMHK